MKVENINPFIESVTETFTSMLDCPVTVGKPSVTEDDDGANDIIGVIGLTGTAKGIVAIKFPTQTAMDAVGKMVGVKFKDIDSSIIDGVGELINIIAGNAKVKFRGQRISLSLPTVVRGNMYKLNNLTGAVFLTLPFDSSVGKFDILVSFKATEKPAMQKEAVHAGANS
jgi:chemotaxis protein CheX